MTWSPHTWSNNGDEVGQTTVQGWSNMHHSVACHLPGWAAHCLTLPCAVHPPTSWGLHRVSTHPHVLCGMNTSAAHLQAAQAWMDGCMDCLGCHHAGMGRARGDIFRMWRLVCKCMLWCAPALSKEPCMTRSMLHDLWLYIQRPCN